MSLIIRIAIAVLLLLAAVPTAWAEESTTASVAAERELQAAQSAIDDARWEDALSALERAYLARADPYYLYQRILVLEKMGERNLALTVLDENRDALVASERVADLAVLEERLRQSSRELEPDGTIEARTAKPHIGPSIPLLVGGGAAVALGGILMAVGVSQVSALQCDPGCRYHRRDGELSESEYESRRTRGNIFAFGGVGLIAAGTTAMVLSYVLPPSRSADRELSVGLAGRSLLIRYTF